MARFGKRAIIWLPLGQLTSLIFSVIGFAFLARTLGPAPFGYFAFYIFLYTIVCLFFDTSAQGYLLTHGLTKHKVRAANINSVLSAISASTGVLVLGLFAAYLFPAESITLGSIILLSLASLFHFLGQVPKAKLIHENRYRQIAFIEFGSTLFSVVCAILSSYQISGMFALCLQLALANFFRFLLCSISSKRLRYHSHETEGKNLTKIWRYGFLTFPLNVSSFLSRSIDTAILPFLVSPVDAALYARSYQIIIAPLSQLQTSLGGAIIQKLSVANPSEKDDLAKRIWQYITLGSTVFGVLAALSAGLIAGLLFGEKWPNAEVYISAMCCGVLVLSQGMYFSWHLQQKPEIKKTLSQLAIGLVVPIGVIAAAYSSSMASVLNTYVFVCLVVLVLYNFRYKQYLPKNIGILRATASTSASWIVLASIYFSWSF